MSQIKLKANEIEVATLLVTNQRNADGILAQRAAELSQAEQAFEAAMREKRAADLGVGAFVVAVSGLSKEECAGRAQLRPDLGVIEVSAVKEEVGA